MGGPRYKNKIFLRIVGECQPINLDQWTEAAQRYYEDQEVNDKKVRAAKAFSDHFVGLCSSADHEVDCAEIKSLIELKKVAQAQAENVTAATVAASNTTTTNNSLVAIVCDLKDAMEVAGSNNSVPLWVEMVTAGTAISMDALTNANAVAPAAAVALPAAAPTDASLLPPTKMIESVSCIATKTRDALEEIWNRAGMPPDERERMYSQLVGDFQKLCDLMVQGGEMEEAARQGDREELVASSGVDGSNNTAGHGDAMEVAGSYNSVPLWVEMVLAVKSCFFVDDPERVTLDERKAAVSAFTKAFCADSDDEEVFGAYHRVDIENLVTGHHPTAQKLKIDDFEISKSLGVGGFGQVFLARHVNSGSIVALKRMVVPRERTWHRTALIREINIQRQLSHEHILKLLDVFVDKKYVYLVLEYAPGGSLGEVLSGHKLSKTLAAKYISGLSQAIQYLHNKLVTHRDIKLDNLLLGFDGKIKIADFGTAANVRMGKERQTQVGTPMYSAPEIYKNDTHDEKVDVWSLGICLYEFLVGKPPTFQGTDIKWPDNFDNDAKDLIGKMLKHEPQERISLLEIANHPFMSRA
ncbi:hypothetical protein ACHAXH_000453 [Discostella pseudostelligera]